MRRTGRSLTRSAGGMRLVASLPFALRRLWIQRGIMSCLFAGMVAAVSLSIAVPVYADMAQYRLLTAALDRTQSESRRPPFNLIFRYVGAWFSPVGVQDFERADRFIQNEAAGVVGLAQTRLTWYVITGDLQLYPAGSPVEPGARLGQVQLACVSQVFEHLRIVEGRLPDPVPSPGQPLETLVSLELANQLGLRAGETYLLYNPARGGAAAMRASLYVAGIWTPSDPGEDYWFFPAQFFQNKLFIPQETFFGPIAAGLPKPVSEAGWSLLFDGSGVRSQQVSRLLRGIEGAHKQVSNLLPNATLEASPTQALRNYRQQSLALTGTLFVFSAPVLGLILYFLGLVAGILVRRQRSEIAVLRSRGASRGWVAAIYLLEWSLLGGGALFCGAWLALGFARLVGRTRAFLDFGFANELSPRLSLDAVLFGLATAMMGLALSAIIAWQSGRFTIVTHKQEAARARLRPFWQRAYLDVLLLLPALYGYYTLRAEGRLAFMGRSLVSGDAFEDPLLFLLPTLFILSLSLLLVRLTPQLLSALAWLSAHSPATVPVLALRQLSRSPGSHMGLLALIVFTLSLAGFVASMAQSLDRYSGDRIYYQVGADLNLTESGEYTGESRTALAGSAGQGQQSAAPSNQANQPALWNFLPVSDHLDLPGVQAATRVGEYQAELQSGGSSAAGNLVGIDRTDFPAVAFFRRDFASESLGGLLNRLALEPPALLVDDGTWARLGLNIGDPLQLQVTIGERRTLTFKAAGVFRYFPTQYPQEGAIFVGNLDYIFESFGGLRPYDVWLKTAPGSDNRKIIEGLQQQGVAVIQAKSAQAELEQLLVAPSRQGVLGLLSVGFLAAAALTITGFLLYALLVYRERLIILGVLRAIGLSSPQMGASLVLEQAFLILVGLAGGLAIGVLTAHLFIPYMPVAFDRYAGTPPFTIEIAMDGILRMYAVFCGLLVLGTGSTLLSLSRMKIFQAVKLGEAF